MFVRGKAAKPEKCLKRATNLANPRHALLGGLGLQKHRMVNGAHERMCDEKAARHVLWERNPSGITAQFWKFWIEIVLGRRLDTPRHQALVD
jgi:hypothetical protein